VVWSIAAADSRYPTALASNAAAWPVLYGLGNAELLANRALGLLCSVQVPGRTIVTMLDAVRELRDAGVVVAGGFHSPMEQECLGFLLRGQQPVIVCPARHPSTHRLPAEWHRGLDTRRLLIVSPFGPQVRRPTRQLAEERNRFVTALAGALWVPHASAGGQTAQSVAAAVAANKCVFVDDPGEAAAKLPPGLSRYNLGSIREVLSPGRTPGGDPTG
jgi:predicted Rossmann fold nucleotide-binding protein DprA/Smf involved in DNA uptake